RRADCFVHHGTLLVETDLERMQVLLKEGGRSAVAPVTNLKESVGGLGAAEAAQMLSAMLSENPLQSVYAASPSISPALWSNSRQG
ncbi:MAG: hypothetical protein ACYC99_18180, partial [Candidatus Geothermincolia bacterium]